MKKLNVKDVSLLIIDDEKDTVELLDTFLSDVGFDVTGICDPEEALRRIEASKFDIVLTDLKMPEISGLDIVQKVKETGYDTLVIIFTGYASIDSAIDAVKYGVYEYIKKPFQIQDILNVLYRAVEKQYLRRKNTELNNRIEHMLSEITTLIDISNILYQVSDYEMASDIVMDTLTEGLKIDKIGLFVYDMKTKNYRIENSRGIHQSLIDQFEFKLGDKINGKLVTATEPIIIQKIRKSIQLNDKVLKIDPSINYMKIFPIQLLDKTVGFLGVFHILDSILPLKDKIKILEILVTQIAPIFQLHQNESRLISGNIVQRNDYQAIIENEINTSKSLDISVSFVVFRLMTNRENIATLHIDEIYATIQKAVFESFNIGPDDVYIFFDSILIMLHGFNAVDIELNCAIIRRKVEDTLETKKGEHFCKIKYAIISYPTDGKSSEKIKDELELKTFQEFGY